MQCDKGWTISIQQINVAVSSMNESIMIDSDGDVAIHVEASDNEWLDLSAGRLSMILLLSDRGLSLTSMICENVH